MSNRIRFLIKLVVTLVLLAFVFYRIDLQKFTQVVGSANLLLILAAALVQIGVVLLVVFRWQVILFNFSMRVPYRPLAQITYIGFFFNLFLPSGIGGDLFRAYYLTKRENRAISAILTTIVLERSAGLCALLAIGVVGTSVQDIRVQGVSLFYLFLAMIGVYLLANVAIFHSWTHRNLMQLLQRLGRGLDEKLEMIVAGLTSLRKNPRALGAALAVSLSIQFLGVVLVWITASAIGLKAPFSVFLIFIPLVNLSMMVPITINGIGLREGLYALLFMQIGVTPEVAVSLSLLQMLVFLIAGVPGGVIYSLYKRGQPVEAGTVP